MRPESMRLQAVAFLDLFDLIAAHHDTLYPGQTWVDPETTIERMVLEIEHRRAAPAPIAGSAGDAGAIRGFEPGRVLDRWEREAK